MAYMINVSLQGVSEAPGAHLLPLDGLILLSSDWRHAATAAELLASLGYGRRGRAGQGALGRGTQGHMFEPMSIFLNKHLYTIYNI